MKRLALGCLLAALTWSLVPGLGEILENASHLVQAGHLAHSAPDGDAHSPSGAEHGCTAWAHLCACCASLSYLPGHAGTLVPPVGGAGFPSPADTRLWAVFPSGIDHPPRV